MDKPQGPYLEKFVRDEDIRESSESNQQKATLQQEQIKPKPEVEEKKQKKPENKIPQNKDSQEYTHFYERMHDEGRLNRENKIESFFYPPSANFFSPFHIIEDSYLKESIKKRPQELIDLSLGKNIIKKEENPDLENMHSIYGYDIREDRDPVKQGLLNKLEELQKTQEEIKRQFKNDKAIYLKRIQMLENTCKAKVDEEKLKNLKKRNEKNKRIIKDYKLKIEQAENEKFRDKQKFSESLNSILKLKQDLINEVNELEIMIKKTNFEDYEEFKNDNPTKIEKINFKPNDSRYLLTNEYETSRDEEESFSSYDKLNNINNTPDVFDINRQNIYLNKTMNNNYTNLNTKNSKFPLGTNADFINDKNNINIHNNTFNKSLQKKNTSNKGTEGNMSTKLKEIKQSQQQNNINNINIQSNNKKTYPKDPDFINENMILMNQDEDEDNDPFY